MPRVIVQFFGCNAPKIVGSHQHRLDFARHFHSCRAIRRWGEIQEPLIVLVDGASNVFLPSLRLVEVDWHGMRSARVLLCFCIPI